MTAPRAHAIRTRSRSAISGFERTCSNKDLHVLVRGIMALPMQLVQGDLVALEEDEKRPVPQYLVDEPIQDPDRQLGGHLRRVDPAQGTAPELVQPEMELDQDVFLAGEVVVDSRLRKTQSLRDLAQRGLLIALLGEQFQGNVENPFPRAALLSEPGFRARPRLCPGPRPGLRHGLGHLGDST